QLVLGLDLDLAHAGDLVFAGGQLGDERVVFGQNSAPAGQPVARAKPQLIAQAHEALFDGSRLADIDCAHREAEFIAAIDNPSAKPDNVHQNFTWRVIGGLALVVLGSAVLVQDQPGNLHRVLAAP